MNHIVIDDKSLCCGCGACVQKCPVQCITLKYDEEGFSYPQVDEKKCINCNQCEKVVLFNENKKIIRKAIPHLVLLPLTRQRIF